MERLKKSGIVGELSAEFLGTMILILFGCGVVAQVVAGGALTDPAGGLGNHDSIAWAWGLGVTLGVYVAARLSGAHLNPAVTLSLAAFKDFPWKKVAPYSLAQLAGAFVAALLVRWNYTEALAKADPGHTIKTQFVFSTLPANGNPALPVHEWGGVPGPGHRHRDPRTADLRGHGPPQHPAGRQPRSFRRGPHRGGHRHGVRAPMRGYAINPARDLGPRLASFLTGYGGAWRDQYGNFYFWVPIVGPLVGGPLGALVYKIFISSFLPTAEPEPEGSIPLPPEK